MSSSFSFGGEGEGEDNSGDFLGWFYNDDENDNTEAEEGEEEESGAIGEAISDVLKRGTLEFSSTMTTSEMGRRKTGEAFVSECLHECVGKLSECLRGGNGDDDDDDDDGDNNNNNKNDDAFKTARMERMTREILEVLEATTAKLSTSNPSWKWDDKVAVEDVNEIVKRIKRSVKDLFVSEAEFNRVRRETKIDVAASDGQFSSSLTNTANSITSDQHHQQSSSTTTPATTTTSRELEREFHRHAVSLLRQTSAAKGELEGALFRISALENRLRASEAERGKQSKAMGELRTAHKKLKEESAFARVAFEAQIRSLSDRAVELEEENERLRRENELLNRLKSKTFFGGAAGN